jgi:hypothetical protein
MFTNCVLPYFSTLFLYIVPKLLSNLQVVLFLSWYEIEMKYYMPWNSILVMLFPKRSHFKQYIAQYYKHSHNKTVEIS